MSKNDDDRKLDQQILKRFKIIREIGSGAYGIVFEALDKVTHQKVALKKSPLFPMIKRLSRLKSKISLMTNQATARRRPGAVRTRTPITPL